MEKKILIIDDDELSANTIKANLERNNEYEVFVETRGTHGFFAAREFKPDLVLLDIKMPEKDGFQILNDLKNNRKTISIPIIMLSGMDDERARIRATQLYCEDYLVKPVTTETLKAKIDAILKIRKIVPPPKQEILEIASEKIKSAKKQIEETRKSKKEYKPGTVVKILVVDDEKSICDLIKTFLAPLGFEVYSTWNPDKAMALFLTKKPDIVLLDLVMPKVDGMEILSRIKELKSGAKVIVLTGVNDLMVIRDATRLGADDVLVKPFSLNQISITLVKHLCAIYDGYRP